MRKYSLVRRNAVSAGVVAATVAALAVVALTTGTAPARADTISPVVAKPAGAVTADALPTAQINGVVWSQAIVGDTVYAGGEFTSARPAGSAVGTNEVPRGNLLSYSVSTGVLTSSFAPSLNAQVKAVAASPDGSRVYVAGAFTTADGAGRYRIAAYSTATGTLIPTFKPVLSTQAYAVVATNTTVYVGGIFTSANGVTRNRAAAFNAADGSLTAWDPNVSSNVNAMVLSPDGSKVILGGNFTTVGSSPQYGLAAVDATTGAVLPWAANQSVRNAGSNAAITSLRADATTIYGTGFVYGAGGNLEGTFSADPATGAVNWVASCHGDSYDNYPSKAGVVYVVSHEHDCSDLGGFRQTDTPWDTYRTTAFTTQATGTLTHDYFGGNYKDWFGTPSPSLVNWYPELTNGSYTGQGQAAWSVTGNDQYVVEGGEFPYVNGKAQQGLVRFAVPSLAPNQQGAVLSGAKWVPNASTLVDGSARISFQANYDRDDPTLRYRVYRNGDTTTPVFTTTLDSQKWNRPMLGFTDTGLTPGATYTYQVYALDPRAFVTKSAVVTVTIPTTPITPTDYGSRVQADGAAPYWPANEASGTTLVDNDGYLDAATTGGLTRGVAGPVVGTTATTFDGVNGTRAVMQSTPISGPNTLSVETWFRTTTTKGGELVGFGSSTAASSQTNDRMIYMDNSGRLYFGVLQNSARRTLRAGFGTYNNGAWHHVVATMSSSGSAIYVDGNRVATDSGMTSGSFLYPGYWRAGSDNLSGWASAPTSQAFAGSLAQIAVYPTALSASQVSAHYGARNSTNLPPSARFTSSCTGLTCSFDASSSTDRDGSIVNYQWTFGDGSTATGVTASHAYSASGTYPVTLTVTDNRGTPNLATGSVSALAPNQLPTSSFTANTTNLTSSFDGSGSSDPDGSIVSYAWNFGDGASDTVAKPSHMYAAAGTYTVTLTVTDNRGGTASSSQTVTASLPPNQLPTSSFTASTTNLTSSFDGSGSSDPDGSIVSYAWNFGDGASDTVAKPSHTYAAAGTYTVTLTVTDNRGATASSSQTVMASLPPNQLPTSSFTASTTNLTSSFDGSGSSDPDGSIVSYAWNFGDGASDTVAKPSHTYAAAGTYTVTLTVTDNRGGTASSSQQVTASLPPNTPPTASFTTTPNGLSVAVDATASTDPDGSIASYAWDFGDGTSGTGVAPTHAYAAAGTYTITLTVTDNRGATGSTTRSFAAASVTTYAKDTFNRTVANGWGTADAGGAWTLGGGTTNFAVTPGAATMRQAAGGGPAAYLNALSSLTDTDASVDVSLDKPATGGGDYVYLVARHVGTSDYRFRVKLLATGAVQVSLTKLVSGTETVLTTVTVSGLTYTAGQVLHLRLQASGSATTLLRGKIWTGATEPTAWTTSYTDSAQPLVSGAPGVLSYLSGSATNAPITLTWSNLSVTAPR